MTRSNLVRLLTALAGFTLTAASAAAQGTGVIAGTVEDSVTGRPLAGAQVFLVNNTKIGVLTSGNGRFVLKSVPTGEQQVSVRFIGYKSAMRTTTVGSDTVRLAIKLIETANVLDQMVVTGTTGATAAKEV